MHSLLGSAVAMLPGTVTVPAFAVVSGIIIAKTYRFKITNSFGWALLTIGFSLMTTLSRTSNPGKQFGFQIIYGIGGGIVFVSRICAVQASQRDEDGSMATALISFTISLGQAFGVGLGGVIFQNQWDQRVAASVSDRQLPASYIIPSDKAEQAAAIITQFPTNVQILYRDIMAKVIDRLFLVLGAVSGFAFVVSLLAKDLSLTRDTEKPQSPPDWESGMKHKPESEEDRGETGHDMNLTSHSAEA